MFIFGREKVDEYDLILFLNTLSVHVLHRGKQTTRTTFAYKYRDKNIELVDSYKYLGFWIGEHGDVVKGSDALVKAGEWSLGSLIHKVKKLGDVRWSTFDRLLNTCVMPVLDYCGGVWGINPRDQHKLLKLDSVIQRIQCFFLGVGKKSALAALDGDMPVPSGLERRVIDGIRFYNLLLKLPDGRLVKEVFNMIRQGTKDNWFTDLEHHLAQIGKLK